MANEESGRGGDERREGIDQFKSVARQGEGDGGAAGNDLDPRGGLPGKGYDAGGGYGGGGNSSAYSGESSYGGQAGYGGSTMDGAYSDGKYGRDQNGLHAAGDAENPVEDRQAPGAGGTSRTGEGGRAPTEAPDE